MKIDVKSLATRAAGMRKGMQDTARDYEEDEMDENVFNGQRQMQTLMDAFKSENAKLAHAAMRDYMDRFGSSMRKKKRED